MAPSHLTEPSYFGLLAHILQIHLCLHLVSILSSPPDRKTVKLWNVSNMWAVPLPPEFAPHLKYFRRASQLALPPPVSLLNPSLTQNEFLPYLGPLKNSADHSVFPAMHPTLTRDKNTFSDLPRLCSLMLLYLHWGDSYHLSCKVQFKCHHLNLQIRWSFPVASLVLSPYYNGTSMRQMFITPWTTQSCSIVRIS